VLTALTLHVDLQHILSNLAFGGLFGWMAGRVLGGGWAWFCIVIAGGIGNFANAVVRDADHLSIGASTGVFAALGILVAHALHPPIRSSEKLLKRWSPLICGSLLLALVGVGDERTDVVAHVTGFVAGCVVGLIACRIPIAYLRNNRFQSITAALAVAIILVAWTIAVS
jgi:membrane associated rhomboid family serine protease